MRIWYILKNKLEYISAPPPIWLIVKIIQKYDYKINFNAEKIKRY